MVLVFWILASWIFVCCVGRKANYGVGILVLWYFGYLYVVLVGRPIMVLVFWYWLLGYLYVVLVGRPIMVLVFWILAS
jgi:hypothetical protein